MKARYAAILLLASLTLRAAHPPIDPAAAQEAERELFAARYDHAAEIYSKLLHDDPSWGPGYYGEVRALIGAYRAHEAYTVAAEGLQHAPESAEAQTAAGVAAYRRGELGNAEAYYRKARQIDPHYAYALSGLASIHYAVSKFKSGQILIKQAYLAAPSDPRLIAAWASTLHGAELLAALERAFAIYDPSSREERRLRARAAIGKTAGGRPLQRLTSPYQSYDIELVPIGVGQHIHGLGLRVKLNDSRTVRLMLDTGAPGIAISAKAAEKTALESLSDESTEVHGIGSKKPQEAFAYLAASVDIGNLRFTDFPVEASKAAETADNDGLIGADVFRMFQVAVDFEKRRLVLTPNPDGPPGEDAVDSSDLPAGFSRMLRFGHMLTVQTSVNQGPARLFLVDSGSTTNLIDSETAQESTKLQRDYDSKLHGLQGRVDNLSRASKVSLTFAGFRQDNSDLLATSLQGLGDVSGVGIAGILGMPVLWQMRMTIDYRNGALRFEKTRRK
jgi:tetratricopeptide (TPR) repeat protein